MLSCNLVFPLLLIELNWIFASSGFLFFHFSLNFEKFINKSISAGLLGPSMVSTFDNKTFSTIVLDFKISNILSPANKPDLPVRPLTSIPNCAPKVDSPPPLALDSVKIKLAFAW